MGGATATRREIRRAFGAQALEIVERHDRMLNTMPAVIEKIVMRVVAPLELQILRLQGELEAANNHMKVFERAPWYRRWWWVLTGRR